MTMKYGDSPKRFRKKPVVIEAMQFTDDNKNQVFNWIACNVYPTWDANGNPALKIQTLEGDMIATIGDWVIKGVKGEFYPCKADIFAATYEKVDEATAIANDLARKTLGLPTDCDVLSRPPTFQERHDANVATLAEIKVFLNGDAK